MIEIRGSHANVVAKFSYLECAKTVINHESQSCASFGQTARNSLVALRQLHSYVIQYTVRLGQVLTSYIAAEQVSTSCIAAEQVSTSCMVAKQVLTSCIAAEQVSTSCIAAEQVSTSCIAAEQVSTSCIAAEQVSTSCKAAEQVGTIYTESVIEIRGSHANVVAKFSYLGCAKNVKNHESQSCASFGPTARKSLEALRYLQLCYQICCFDVKLGQVLT